MAAASLVPLQLEGCPIVYIIKFTHYAIGGVAAPHLHTQGVRHYSIFRLYGAVASASPLSGGLFTSGWLRVLRRGYEGDGTCPPRPPGSSPGSCLLRPGQVGLRFNVMLGGWGLLVDSSGR